MHLLQVHAALSSSIRGFRHAPGDVEDACWQLLGEVQLWLQHPEERLFIARLMEGVADKAPIITPGAAFGNVSTVMDVGSMQLRQWRLRWSVKGMQFQAGRLEISVGGTKGTCCGSVETCHVSGVHSFCLSGLIPWLPGSSLSTVRTETAE